LSPGEVPSHGQRSRGSRGWYIVVLVVLAIAAGIVVWAVVTGKSSNSSKVQRQLLGVTRTQLSTLAAQQGHEVYWAGPRPGVRYEWTRTTSGRIYVRYLRGSTKIGARNKTFLTVATYSFPNAKKAVQELANRTPGSQTRDLPGGALVYHNPKVAPTSAYLAFPGSDYEVEVFDPRHGKAYSIAKSGDIQEIK
jgi:hypothetical protein